MRLVSVILAFIGIWGLFYPQSLLNAGKGDGNWVFCVILALASLAFWRSFCKNK